MSNIFIFREALSRPDLPENGSFHSSVLAAFLPRKKRALKNDRTHRTPTTKYLVYMMLRLVQFQPTNNNKEPEREARDIYFLAFQGETSLFTTDCTRAGCFVFIFSASVCDSKYFSATFVHRRSTRTAPMAVPAGSVHAHKQTKPSRVINSAVVSRSELVELGV